MKARAASEELEEIIHFAIEREEEAVHFYKDLEFKVQSRAVAKEIHKLVGVEKKHRDRLARINVVAYAKALRTSAAIPSMAKYMVEEKPNSEMSLQELFSIAMHREQASVALYTDLSKLFAGPARRLFENLAAEECSHVQIFDGE